MSSLEFIKISDSVDNFGIITPVSDTEKSSELAVPDNDKVKLTSLFPASTMPKKPHIFRVFMIRIKREELMK